MVSKRKIAPKSLARRPNSVPVPAVIPYKRAKVEEEDPSEDEADDIIDDDDEEDEEDDEEEEEEEEDEDEGEEYTEDIHSIKELLKPLPERTTGSNSYGRAVNNIIAKLSRVYDLDKIVDR